MKHKPNKKFAKNQQMSVLKKCALQYFLISALKKACFKNILSRKLSIKRARIKNIIQRKCYKKKRLEVRERGIQET